MFRSITPDGRDVLDISHESLLRHWPQLRQWLQVEAESARRFEQLQQQVRDGVTELDGVSLALADRWRNSARPAVTWSRRYLPKSLAAKRGESLLPRCLKLIDDSLEAREAAERKKERDQREREEAQVRELEITKKLAAAEADRAALEQKKTKVIRRWLVLAVCLAIGAVALAVYAWHKSDEAQAATRRAKKLAADICLQNGNTAIRHLHDAPLGAAWFAEGLRVVEDVSPATRFAARSLSGGWSRSLPRHSLVHDGPVFAVSISPDGRTLATASGDLEQTGEARLWDAETGQPRGEPLQHDGSVNAVSISPDGRTLATASYDNKARLWEVPPPAPDDPEWVRLAVEVTTGKTIENALVRTLTQAEWLERKERLDARGQDCLRRTWDDLTEAEKLELRTPAAR